MSLQLCVYRHRIHFLVHVRWQVLKMMFASWFIVLFLVSWANAQETSYESRYYGDALVHSATKEGNTQPPFIFIPGLNLASYIFCITPDGREGWADIFVNAGHNVYIVNGPSYDFRTSSAGVVEPWTVPMEGGPPSTDFSAQGWQRDIWSRWGFGESQGMPYPDVRFPVDDFDEFAANYPYIGSGSTQLYSAAIEELMVELNTTVILAPHSMGGPQAVIAAKNLRTLVLGIVFLEPVGPPTEVDFPALAGLHMFAPYMDRIESRRQTGRKAGVEAAAELFAQYGGVAEVVSFPDDLGIFGNTHLFMQDDNNVFIAEMIMNTTSTWPNTVNMELTTTLPPTSSVTNLPTDSPTTAAPTSVSTTQSPIGALPEDIDIRTFSPSAAPTVTTTLEASIPVPAPSASFLEYKSQYYGDALVHSATISTNTKPPFIFIPGLNLASYIFCTTPDGREGWADTFLFAGHDVYIVNAPTCDFRTSSAGVVEPWLVPTDGGPPASNSSSQGWQRDIWSRWGFGESQGMPYPDVRFPVDDFDEFAANYPYIGSGSTQLYSAAIEELMVELNTTVILAPHSMGGPQAVAAAKNLRPLVLGIVFLEPVGPPTEVDFPALAGLHMFAPYMDRIESRRQTGRKAGVEAAAELFAQYGGVAEVVSFPDDLGIFGNTHLFMQDDNNVFIAEMIMNTTDFWTSSDVQSDFPSDAPSDMPSLAPNVMLDDETSPSTGVPREQEAVYTSSSPNAVVSCLGPVFSFLAVVSALL